MTQHEDSEAIQIVPDPDKLDRYHRQQLSAMLDGELSPDQARFMLRRLQHDTALADCWERWQICGDMLRGQRNALLPPDFAQKVSAAIAADDGAQVPAARQRAGGPRLLRWGGGAALAASVAMAALLVGRQGGIEPEPAPARVQPQFAASQPAPVSPAPEAEAPVPVESPSLADAAAAAAGTALAAAKAPRRTASRRAPAQADAPQPAAPERAEPRLVAAVAAPAAPAATEEPAAAQERVPDAGGSLFAGLPPAREGLGADPFASLPMTVASRPWPRAEGVGGGYAVGLGGIREIAPSWPTPAPAARWAHGPAELFGLPAAPPPRLSGTTAIGTRAVGAGAAEAGPR